jgi:hypothetical protein
VSGALDWFDRHAERAPAPLRERARAHLAAVGRPLDPPAALAEAGRAALDGVVAQPGDRSAALDLLAADALVTLALLAQAEAAPERLGAFAGEILRGDRRAP